MPIYIYQCAECELEIEEMRPMSRADDPVECPLCERVCTRGLTTFNRLGAASTSAADQSPAKPLVSSHRPGCPCCVPRAR